MEASNLNARQNFPPELVDLIIDHNHSDPATLMVCALVAKQWVPSSRFHLFAKVDISHDTAREFIQLLSSRHCTFTSIVHNLEVHFVSGSQRWFSEFSRRLAELDKTLITSVSILGATPTVLREEARAAVSSFYPRVRNLVIGRIVLETFTGFVALISGLPTLESLTCASTFQTCIMPDLTEMSVHLRQLHLSSPSIKPVLHFFLDNHLTQSITSLSFSFPSAEDYLPVLMFLETSNPILRALSIKMDSSLSGVTLDTFADSFSLARLGGLQELSVHTVPRMPPSQAFVILTKISSPRMEVLEISVVLETGIGRLDILLTSPRFATLKKVTVVGAEWADVCQFMPRCRANNILQRL